MKKATIVYLFAVSVCCILFSSYNAGPALTNGWDCTGAETGLQNPTGCSFQGQCHSPVATAGIGITIQLDSAGVATTHYKAGMNYTVKLTGINNTNSTLPSFGFQMASIKGSSAVATPSNSGTWKTPYPSGTHYATPQAGNFVVGLVEQSSPQSPTSGSGSSGTVYSKTFSWTAPTSGTGTISIWAALNAVNGNTQADGGDLWNTNHIAISEWGNSSAGISFVESKIFPMNVFPNPVSNILNLAYTLNETSNVSIQLFDMEGRLAADLLNEIQNSGLQNLNISLPSQLHDGVYILKTSANDQQYLKKIIVSR